MLFQKFESLTSFACWLPSSFFLLPSSFFLLTSLSLACEATLIPFALLPQPQPLVLFAQARQGQVASPPQPSLLRGAGTVKPKVASKGGCCYCLAQPSLARQGSFALWARGQQGQARVALLANNKGHRVRRARASRRQLAKRNQRRNCSYDSQRIEVAITSNKSKKRQFCFYYKTIKFYDLRMKLN